jgi:hypothetical protein
LGRVRLRLFLANWLLLKSWALIIGSLLASGWILAQPYLISDAAESLRWIVAGSLLSVCAVAGCVVALMRQPSLVSAALALDERFALRERVTTSLLLSPSDAATAAGQALLADVEQKLANVRVADRFPVRVPGVAALVLPSMLCAVLLGMFWNPEVNAGGSTTDDALVAAPELKNTIDQQMKQLATRKNNAKKDAVIIPAKEIERIEKEVEAFAKKPRDSKDDVQDRIKDATDLEEMIRNRQKELAERADAMKEQMKQAQRLTRKKRDEDKAKDGPAKNAQDALARGDMKQAQDELQRLSNEFEKQQQHEEKKESLKRKKRDPMASEEEKKQAEDELAKLDREQGMSKEDRDKLAKQLEQMEDDLKRLSRNKDEQAKDLKEMADRGEIDKEQLDRELDQLERNADKLEKDQQEMKELAQQLGECKKCMGEGKEGEAAKQLGNAAKKMGEMDKEQQNAAMAQKLAQIRQVKKAMCKAVNKGDGPGGAGVGAGARPETKDDETAGKDMLIKGEQDKGKLEAIGTGPIGGFKGPRLPGAMREEIRQTTQEAAAAIERQRLPASARKMAKGYFEKVRINEQEPKK